MKLVNFHLIIAQAENIMVEYGPGEALFTTRII